MKTIFLLWHTRELSDGEDDSKLIGVYESHDAAKRALARASKLPGFSAYPDGFEISSREIGKDEWSEGFVTVGSSAGKTLYAAVHERCDEILQYVWDPIGVGQVPEARDEYSSYVPGAVRLLMEERKEEDLFAYLHEIASERMGLSQTAESDAHTRAVADLLCRHYRQLKSRSRPSS